MIELQNEINELKEWKRQMESSHSIPLNIDQAFRARFLSASNIATSSKGATTENHAVNESGSSSYSVLGIPDGFIQVTISGTIYYIPYYS